MSAASVGALSCWFAINSLMPSRPVVVLRLLLTATGLLLLAGAVGFAALAGYKAFDGAM